jgi:ribulose-phosphate 3-epimerase
MSGSLFNELKKSSPLLSVGVMSADLMRLPESVAALEDHGVRLLHFDVMDGRFCPYLTAGALFVKGIRTTLLKDVHLMVEDPLRHIPEFAAAGADLITVHAEAGRYVHRALQVIAEQTSRPVLRGIALNPGTPLAVLEPLLDEADIVFLLAVNPGFPKQRFTEATCRRFEALKAMAASLSRKPLLGIDGGITKDTIGAAAALGPDIIVTGSAVFDGGNIAENLAFMRQKLRKG